MEVRLYRTRQLSIDDRPVFRLRTKKSGSKGARMEMFARGKMNYQTNCIEMDKNCRIGVITQLNEVGDNVYKWQDVRKAIIRDGMSYKCRSNSEVFTVSDVTALLKQVLNFAGYHANNVLAERFRKEGKLRLVVNTIVEVKIPGRDKVVNVPVYDIVVKGVYGYDAFRLRGYSEEVRSRTSVVNNLRELYMGKDGVVVDKVYSSVSHTVMDSRVRPEGFHYTIYDVFIDSNTVRGVQRMIEVLMASAIDIDFIG